MRPSTSWYRTHAQGVFTLAMCHELLEDLIAWEWIGSSYHDTSYCDNESGRASEQMNIAPQMYHIRAWQ